MRDFRALVIGVRVFPANNIAGDHRLASESEWEAKVSPSQSEWLSSSGLKDPDEIDEDEPTVQSSASCGPLPKSASA